VHVRRLPGHLLVGVIVGGKDAGFDVVTVLRTSDMSGEWSGWIKNYIEPISGVRSICVVKSHPKRENEWTFAGRTLGLVPTNSVDDLGECWEGTSNHKRRRRGYQPQASPSVLRTSEALNGDVEAPGESHMSVRIPRCMSTLLGNPQAGQKERKNMKGRCAHLPAR